MAETDDTITATFFNINDFKKVITNAEKTDDKKLIALYKILSPVHLIKLSFANDSNSLDKNFYNELLHIIGLEEVKDGSKKLIQRKKISSEASLLENAIIKLKDKDCLRDLSDATRFGLTTDEQLYNISLELCITWVNRILFLKLLEAQLFAYHQGSKEHLFLNDTLIHDFDELSNLFFQVLAEKSETRRESLQTKFSKVPYLNSSLFERTELERKTIDISALDNGLNLPLHEKTVLKNATGKKLQASLSTLSYLFSFLDSYDFTSEGKAEIQEENKTLINASVLGLIFEKINGYKDGSFFTPGFITMYMCRETLRRAVIQKFNETNGWNCQTFDDLQGTIDFTDKEKRQQANNLINSLSICDPAVGSGHFLVSALNELISIKHDLKLLQYQHNAQRIREYSLEIVNDELIIRDIETEDLFEYTLNQKGNIKPELQHLQETLFHEKETLIENCLFGVDINANSVKICRLRLWIELLKNAYYTKESNYSQLETLPNIDINIKQGNSLISRFALDADLSGTLQKSKWNIDSYKLAVQTYRNAQSKEEKRQMEELIDTIKKDFRTDISPNDPINKKLYKLRGELKTFQQTDLFNADAKKKTKANKELEKLSAAIDKLEKEKDEIQNNAIYKEAFEWRFEFPEVLNSDGIFLGFDVVIGNPPYGVEIKQSLNTESKILFKYKTDSYQLFAVKAFALINDKGIISQIIPNAWMARKASKEFRDFLLLNNFVIAINFVEPVFEDANIDTCICILKKNYKDHIVLTSQIASPIEILKLSSYNEIPQLVWKELGKVSCSLNMLQYKLLEKININSEKLALHFDVFGGYKPYQVGYGKSVFGDFPQTEEDVINRVYHSDVKLSEEYFPDIKGSNIQSYSITKNSQWVKWGSWLMSPKKIEYFLNSKIVVREIVGKRLIAALDDSGYFTNDTTHLIVNKSTSKLKFLVALLNSNLFAWFFKKCFGEENDLFPKVKVNELKDLPVRNDNANISPNLIQLVEKIITAKKENPQAETTQWENEIDELVYKLYELTEEEIKIVKTA